MTEILFSEITNLKQRRFLVAFRECGNVRASCEAAGIARSSHYRWLDEDPEYSEAFEMAKDDAVDLLEAEVRRRALEGWEGNPPDGMKGNLAASCAVTATLWRSSYCEGAAAGSLWRQVRCEGRAGRDRPFHVARSPAERIVAGEHPLAVLASAQTDHPALSSVDKNIG